MLYYALVYGLFTILGGLMGYLKAGSTMSLLTGGGSGALILVSTVLAMNGKSMGYLGLWLMSLFLGGFFLVRFLKTFSPMPAGVMVALSVGMLVFLVLHKTQILQASR